MTDASNTDNRPTAAAELMDLVDTVGIHQPDGSTIIPAPEPCGAALTARCFNGADGCPTHRSNTTLVDRAFFERFGTLPRRAPGRAQKIAAIHALAEWFAQHPEAPMPEHITALYYVAPHDEPDEQVRYTDYRLVRDALDGKSYPVDNVGRLDRNFQFDHVPVKDSGMVMEYRVAYTPNRGAL